MHGIKLHIASAYIQLSIGFKYKFMANGPNVKAPSGVFISAMVMRVRLNALILVAYCRRGNLIPLAFSLFV